MDEKFPRISPGTTTVVALESVGSKTMNRKWSQHLRVSSTASQAGETNQINGHSAYNRHQQSNKKSTPAKMPGIELIIRSCHQTSNATASQATSTESRTCTEPLLTPQQKSWPQIQSRNQIYCAVGSQELLNLEINSIITSLRELINWNATNLLHERTSARNKLHTCCFENKTDNLNQV